MGVCLYWRSLHLLINAAGTTATPLTRDARGYESQFSANHLGTFQLTPRAETARVVTASSTGIDTLRSTSTTLTSDGASMTSGRPTGSPNQRTSFSPLVSTKEVKLRLDSPSLASAIDADDHARHHGSGRTGHRETVLSVSKPCTF